MSQLSLSEATLPAYLERLGLLLASDVSGVEPVGDGNINWVRRVRRASDGTSFVVKQARPALERFPQYRASTERIVFEHRYFEIAQRFDEHRVCPSVIRFDEEQRVLVLEDLGDAERLDQALARGRDPKSEIGTLGAFLGAMHRGTRNAALVASFPNHDMQRLHGDHIFQLPFHPNDFSLTPRLRPEADRIQRDASLTSIADRAYARYLEPRGALLHGDVQPGNVLLTATGAKLLDAEIAHVGDPAFDAGVLVAHLLLHAVARDDLDGGTARVATFWRAYVESCGEQGPIRFAAVSRYAGIEMIRRTIGAARVTAVESEEIALAVLDLGARLMRDPPENPDGLEQR